MKRVISAMLLIALVTTSITGCGKKAVVAQKPKPQPPFTTDYQLTAENADYFLANDTAETAMGGGPFYAGAQPLPSQRTGDFDKARAARVEKIVDDAAKLIELCTTARGSIGQVRADYVTYLDELQKADKATAKFAGATAQVLVTNTAKQAIAEAEYRSLTETRPADAPAFTTAFMDYLAVVKAVDLAGLYLKDLDEAASFSALALETYKGFANVTAANSALDTAMAKDYPAAVKAAEPIAKQVALVDAELTALTSADCYFSKEAIGFMRSEIVKLQPKVEALAAREGITSQDVSDTRTCYDGLVWFSGQLESLVTSEAELGLAMAEEPVRGLNPFGVDAAYAAEGYTPGQSYGSGLALLTEPAKPTPPAQSGGYLSSAWSGIKSAFGAVKTGIGVGIDTAGAAVQTVSAVGCGIYYGNKPGEIIGHIKQAGQEVITNYNNNVSGSTTIKTAGGYLEGAETAAGNTAGSAAGSFTEWAAGKAGASGQTGKTIASWTSWATNGVVKITAGMFTGMAKGIYKVADKQSSTADVVSGVVDIGLNAIGGSTIIMKASQIPGLTKGTFEGMKQMGKAILNLGKSAAVNAEKGEALAAIKAALAAKGLTPAQVENLISNSIRVELAEQTAKALTASRAEIVQKLKDIIAAGGKDWWKNLKGEIASSWSDMVKKGFDKSMSGYLDAIGTVTGTTLGDYIDNLVANGLTDGMLADLVNQALAIPPDPGQVDGTYKGNMLITAIDIPESESKTAEEAKCMDAFRQLKGKNLGMTLKVSATGDRVSMTGQGGNGSGSCSYDGGAITMKVASQGSTITFTGTAKLAKEGGVTMSGSWVLPYKGSKIIMRGTWTAKKGD